jgi:hypothetical protein
MKLIPWDDMVLLITNEDENRLDNRGQIHPLAHSTRAQAAQVIYNLLSK